MGEGEEEDGALSPLSYKFNEAMAEGVDRIRTHTQKNSLLLEPPPRSKETGRKSSSGFSHHQPQIFPNVEILEVFLDKRLLISTENMLTRSSSQQQHIRRKSFRLDTLNSDASE